MESSELSSRVNDLGSSAVKGIQWTQSQGTRDTDTKEFFFSDFFVLCRVCQSTLFFRNMSHNKDNKTEHTKHDPHVNHLSHYCYL